MVAVVDAINFDSLIEDASVVANESSLVQALRINARSYGFEHFAYLYLSEKPLISISSYPVEWKKAYLAQSYHEIDPVLQTASLETRLYAWSLDDYLGQATPDQIEFLRNAAAFGISTGISIPVFVGHGAAALLTFASTKQEIDVSAIDPIRASIAATLVHAQIAFLRSKAGAKKSLRLSHRQATCLKWASEGKTMDEIANIIGISKQSVRFHLDEARHRLNAANLVQASAIAARHRLV